MFFFYQITLRSLVAKIQERIAKILYRKIAESWYCGKIQVKQLSVELFSVDTSRMQPGLGDGTLKWEPNVIVGLWAHSCAMTSGQLDVKPDKSNKIWSNHRPSPLPSYPRPDQGKKSAGGQGIYILCIFRRRRKQRRV